MFNLNQRSSIASSIVTALIGWMGTIVITQLYLRAIFCWQTDVPLILFCTAAQLLFVKITFFSLRLHKSVAAGAIWGAVASILLFMLVRFSWDFATFRFWVWLAAFTVAGASVGGFLSYFYIDDQRIQLAQSFRKKVNYGRDALWLVPFAYGAGAFLLAFLPTLCINILFPAVVVGAMEGVVAAGISHYTNDEWKFNPFALWVLILLPGTAIGLAAGFLFGQYGSQLPASSFVFTTAGSLLTFAVTLLKGHQLARKEMEGRL
jgi:hypothetical protein